MRIYELTDDDTHIYAANSIEDVLAFHLGVNGLTGVGLDDMDGVECVEIAEDLDRLVPSDDGDPPMPLRELAEMCWSVRGQDRAVLVASSIY